MSCEFISELRRLSKLSAEAVQNLDHFDPLKKYMHITRHTEIDFKQLLLKIAEVNHKQLVLVCGSAGDGKSHLLSYLKYSDQDHMMEIDKDTLSKGETQVFVMSLYWAMMQQCKCELPFIIDTPFARIDTDHRANIVEQFFKRLPGQLFVLSTNEEIGSKHMLALHDQTSNIFLLEYGDDKCTHIMNNQYFEV